MSRSLCKVKGCSNNKAHQPHLSFFRFPKDNARLGEWLMALELDTVKPHDVVCSIHFEDKYILKYGGQKPRTMLAINAQPTLSLHQSSTTGDAHEVTAGAALLTSEAGPSSAAGAAVPTSEAGPSSSAGAALPTFEAAENMDTSMESPITAPPIAASTPTKVQAPTAQGRRKPISLNPHMVEVVRDMSKRQTRLKMMNKKKRQAIQKMRGKQHTWQQATAEVRKRVNPLFYNLFVCATRNFGRKGRGRRYEIQDKMLAMAMHCRSPRLYNYMRNFLCLPTTKTLRNTFNSINLVPGVNPAIKRAVTKKAQKMSAEMKKVVVMGDEISLQRGISYCKRKDTMVGFQDLGPLGKKKEIATHAYAFLVKSIYGSFKYPVAWFASANKLTGEDIALLTEKVISEVISCGLEVKAMVQDGPTKNRKAYRILGATTEKPYFFVGNQKVYAFLDPPHLIKTVRNSLLSHDFLLDGHVIKWDYIKDFYDVDKTLPAKIAPKLTRHHIEPDERTKMRVNKAVQVLSSSVAAGIFTHTTLGKLPCEAVHTAEAILQFDELTDSFNGTTVADPVHPPLKSFRVALTDSSPHLSMWAKTKDMLRKFTFRRRKGGLKVRELPFQSGLIQSITAFEMLWADLKKEGHKYLPTRSINQDPLENLFSSIRYNGGNNRNPTVAEFVPALSQSMVSLLSKPTTGNCEMDDSEMLLELQELFGEPDEEEEIPIPAPLPAPASQESAAPGTSAEGDCSLSSNDSSVLSSQGESYIAGALVRKVLKKIDNCQECSEALTTTEQLEAHLQLTFRDEERRLTYASQPVCQLVSVIKSLGQSVLPDMFYGDDVLKTFRSRSRELVDVDSLNLCPEHVEPATTAMINYACNVSFFDEIKRYNANLKEHDVLSRMVRARARRNRQQADTSEPSSSMSQFIADFCEEISQSGYGDEDSTEELYG